MCFLYVLLLVLVDWGIGAAEIMSSIEVLIKIETQTDEPQMMF